MDVLVVLDNADSMRPVAELLASAALAASLEGLDWGLGVTTASVAYDRGATAGIDAGEGGNEMHLEALALALCRSTDAPPGGCLRYEGDGQDVDSLLASTADLPPHGLLRAGSAVMVLLVTDEGDNSPRTTRTASSSATTGVPSPGALPGCRR